MIENKYSIILTDIQNIINNHKEIHTKKFNIIMNWYNCLLILSIILTPLAGLLSAINTILHPEEEKLLPVLSAVISFVSGITITVVKQFNIHDKGKYHNNMISEYTKLNIEIKKRTTLDIENYDNIVMFINELYDKYSSILIDLKVKNINDEKQEKYVTLNNNDKMMLYELKRMMVKS